MTRTDGGPISSGTLAVRRETVPLVLILLLAAFARLFALELANITPDEGIHGMIARNIAVLHALPVVGLPSVGIRNSALFMYLLSIPYWIVRHPLAGVAFVALLNVAAVLLTWRVARRFGLVAAILASLLFAWSPWSIMYGRTMWPPSCVAVFALLLIDHSFSWLEDGHSRRLLSLTALAGLLPQVHFSGFCGPVWLLAVLWSGRRRLHWRPIVGGMLLALAAWFPWIYWQHAINDWVDIRSILRAAKGERTFAETLAASVDYLQGLLHTGRFDYWFPGRASDLPQYFPKWLSPACRVVEVGMIILFALSILRGLRPRAPVAQRLLVLWALLPLPMLLLIRPVVHPHYLLVAYPAPFILIGAMIGDWLGAGAGPTTAQRSPRYWSRVFATAGGIAVVLGVFTLFTLGWYRYLNDDRPTGRGHFQMTYRQRLAVAQSVLDDAGQRFVELAGFFNGFHPAFDLPYLYEQERRESYKLPRDDSRLYWLDEEVGETFPDSARRVLRESRGFTVLAVEKQWRVGGARVFRLVGRRD